MIENGRVRCNECDNKYGSYLQEKSKENEQKNQQITSLKEENKTLNQKLETERQAKKEAERSLEESKIQQEQAQIELTQLQEELVKVKQELTQAQEKLKEQMEKSPQTNTEQLIERLEKSGKDLTASQKLVQNPKLNHQDLIEVKDQLDNSRRILAAAAAHTQSVEKASQLQAQVKPTKIHEQSNKTNYLPYLVGGLVISGSLVLGLFF
jgi:colicin import membrane protein